MKYKYIDRHTIEPAPKTLTVIKDGIKKVLLTPSVEAYEKQGYFEPAVDTYPDDGYTYTPVYEKTDTGIVQHWERGEKIEPIEEKTEVQKAFDIVADNASKATTIKGLVNALVESANTISEGIE